MNLSSVLSSRWLRVLLGLGAMTLLVVIAATSLARLVGGAVNDEPDNGAPVSVVPGIAVEVTIPPGASARQIGVILTQAGVISSAGQFEISVRDQEVANQLRAGVYQLETAMTINEVLPILLLGPIADSYRVTIREGLRVNEIIDVLAEASGRQAGEFEDALLEREVSTELRVMPEGKATLADWEGLLFP
ncbi:MAG: endolytic transglycosylase MltG, partial [Acidimicrobiia bacterium]|nr:endolytic transglycosylase MltG [Acidimicrobiia bacterium]